MTRKLRRGLIATGAALLLAAGTAALVSSLYIEAKAMVGQVLLEDAWDETVASGKPAKPWSWADTWPVARVAVPAHEASAIVLAGASGEAMAWGPGLMAGTPQPGEAGTSIIAAHRDTHFAFLEQVRVDDEIEIARADGKQVRFRVTGMRVVPWDASGIDPMEGHGRLALVTCYPFNARTSGPLRYVVFAQRIGPPDADPVRVASVDEASPEVRMAR